MTNDQRRDFPADFLFGAATAAFQIEGAGHEDGRTDSIWDAFCRVPGAVIDGHDGMVACDHYHRYAEDAALMGEIGLQTYRFSTSWSRVRPDGGAVNPKGVDFYDRLVDQLIANNVKPWLTLYHWDLPQALEEKGGWTNRDTSYLFAEYAHTMYEALGDRVKIWTTLNEPWCSSFLSYTAGAHAPGRQDKTAGLAAMHHLLLGHGLAVQDLRAQEPELSLGITLNLTVAEPVDPTNPADVDAARRIDGQFNRLFLDPIFRGSYPADVLSDVAGLGLEDYIKPGDLAITSTPIDVLGVNYYHGERLAGTPAPFALHGDAPTDRATSTPFPAVDGVYWHPTGAPITAMQWEVQPELLTTLLKRVNDEYSAAAGVRLFVTENGAAYNDEVTTDETGATRVHDAERTVFLESHLAAILNAIDQGVDVGGYFYWSLMDNFEWAWGYHKRFGIVRVDYDTQERSLKDSALSYQGIIRERALTREPQLELLAAKAITG